MAALIAAIASAVLALGILGALVSLTRTMRAVRETVEELRLEALPLVRDARQAVGAASAEVARVDTLLGSAESISATVDSASRLAYLAFSNPVIKAMALGAGTTRAARRLRRGREKE